ncbi:MAG: hypothetical protein AAF585_20505 [Verrucomicrobiota bacterium]
MDQIAKQKPGGLSFPVVFSFDIIQAMAADRIANHEPVGKTLRIAKKLGIREIKRQSLEAKLLIKSQNPEVEFEELLDSTSEYDLLDGEVITSLG